jgi:hypothetical protein
MAGAGQQIGELRDRLTALRADYGGTLRALDTRGAHIDLLKKQNELLRKQVGQLRVEMSHPNPSLRDDLRRRRRDDLHLTADRIRLAEARRVAAKLKSRNRMLRRRLEAAMDERSRSRTVSVFSRLLVDGGEGDYTWAE